MATQEMASSLSAANKDALMKKLQDAKVRDKRGRKEYSTEPLRQALYHRKITQINHLIEKLNKDEDFPPEGCRHSGRVAGQSAAKYSRKGQSNKRPPLMDRKWLPADVFNLGHRDTT
jgi:hypothetical protein